MLLTACGAVEAERWVWGRQRLRVLRPIPGPAAAWAGARPPPPRLASAASLVLTQQVTRKSELDRSPFRYFRQAAGPFPTPPVARCTPSPPRPLPPNPWNRRSDLDNVVDHDKRLHIVVTKPIPVVRDAMRVVGRGIPRVYSSSSIWPRGSLRLEIMYTITTQTTRVCATEQLV